MFAMIARLACALRPWGLLLLVAPALMGQECPDRGADLEAVADFETSLTLRDTEGREVRSFAVGQVVTMVVTIHNRSGERRTLTLPTAQAYDCIVSRPDGTEIWRWSKGRMFAQVVTELSFEPDESKSWSQTWDRARDDGRPAAAGEYVAIGLIPARAPGTTSDPARFTLE